MGEKVRSALKTWSICTLLPAIAGFVGGLLLIDRWSWINPLGTAILAVAVVTSLQSLRTKPGRAWKLLWYLHSLAGFSGGGYLLFRDSLEIKGWPIWLGALLGILGVGFVLVSIWILGKKRMKQQGTAKKRRSSAPTATPKELIQAAQARGDPIEKTIDAFISLGDGNTTVNVSELMRQMEEVAKTRATEAETGKRKEELERLSARMKLLKTLYTEGAIDEPTYRSKLLALGEELGLNATPKTVVIPAAETAIPTRRRRPPVTVSYTPVDVS